MSDRTAVGNAIVIGGGIGGLTAALCLRRAGIDVTIYEQAPEITEVGAGLQVAPNATKVLRRLGLGDVLEGTGVLPDLLESLSMAGELLAVHDLNADPPPYGAPHYVMYRPDLIDGLRRGLPDSAIVLSKECVSVEQTADEAVAVFADGSRASADLIVAADGIKSRIRQVLFGADEVSYSGRVGYRSLLPAEAVADLALPNTTRKYWGPVLGHHLVHYFVAGGTLLNVFAVVPEEQWTAESWTARGSVDELRAAFAEFASPVPEMVGRIEEPYKWALNDRPPLDAWSQGRVTLLGDACHPMVPFLGQGATMAVEDAVILARCLSAAGDLPRALEAYERTRKARTTAMQTGSRTVNANTWSDRAWIYGYDAWEADIDGLDHAVLAS